MLSLFLLIIASLNICTRYCFIVTFDTFYLCCVGSVGADGIALRCRIWGLVGLRQSAKWQSPVLHLGFGSRPVLRLSEWQSVGVAVGAFAVSGVAVGVVVVGGVAVGGFAVGPFAVSGVAVGVVVVCGVLVGGVAVCARRCCIWG